MTSDAPSVDLAVADAIATITINNPAKRNSFDPAMFEQLRAAAERVADDESVRVVVLRGAGEKAFSAGADFDSIAKGPDYLASFNAAGGRMDPATDAVSGLDVPVIAALRGVCMGGGVQVALSADFRVAADDLVFGVPAVTLGIIYPFGAIEKLTRLAGPATVKKLLIEGGTLGAEEAWVAGFVEEVVPVAAFERRIADLAARIAGHPPATVRAYKRIVDNIVAGRPEANPAVKEDAYRSGELAARLGEVARRREEKRANRASG